jgi:hypothetical protein
MGEAGRQLTMREVHVAKPLAPSARLVVRAFHTKAGADVNSSS